MAAIGGIFDGVAENVHHDLLQAAAVAHDQRQLTLRRVGQLMAPLLGVKTVGADNALDGIPEGETGEYHVGPAPVQPAQCQKVLHDMGHAVRFRDDNIKEAVFHVPGKIVTGIPDGLGIAADIGKRGTQFMGHIGDKFLPPLLIAVLLRDVMEQNQNAALSLIGKGRQVKRQRPVAHHQLVLNVIGLLQGQHLVKGMQVPQQLLIGAALVNIPVQQLRGGGVAVNEMPLAVKSHHTVRHVEEQRIQLVALVFHGGQR